MVDLTVTAKGQVTLRKDVLNHLGVRPGDKITVHMHPLRNGAYGGELMWVKKADGTVLGGGGPPPDPAAGDHPATTP